MPAVARSHTVKHLYLSLTPSFGAQIILLYLLSTYALPIACTAIASVPEGLYNDAHPQPGAVGLLLLLIASVLVTSCARIRRPRRQIREAVSYRLSFISPGLQLLVLGVLVCVALVVYAQGMNDWRYTGVSLSETGSPLLLVYALVTAAMRFFLFVFIFFDTELVSGWRPSQVSRKLLLCAGLLLTANGIATMLYAALAILFVMAPRSVYAMIFHRSESVPHANGGVPGRAHPRVILTAGLASVGVAASWILGEAIKRNDIGSVLTTVAEPEFVTYITEWFVGRISSSYYSLRIALDQFALSTDPAVLVNHLMAPVESFIYRANHLLLQPFAVDRPDAGSMMRINYLQLSPFPFDVRQGTSPGLLASFLMSMPLPFNYFVLLGYILVIQRLITRLGYGLPGRLTFAGKMLFWPFLLTLFESPVDFLLIIDDAVLSLLLVLWLCMRVRNSDARGAATPLSPT